MEKYTSLLVGDAKKLAIKKAHVPPAPISMFSHEERTAVQSTCKKGPTMHVAPFHSVLGKDKSPVHKPMLDQSWYGSLHDAHLQ
jgi:hypothetical protein